MKITDFITDDKDKGSHTKLWSNVGYATLTFVLIWCAVHSSTLIVDLFIAYGAIVALHNTASKFIGAKFGASGTTLESKE